MKKIYCLISLLALLVMSCGHDELLDKTVQRPAVPEGKSLVTITGDGMKAATKSTASRVEFEGGYATGGGLYNGDANVEVKAVPYAGYQLVEFIGGPVDGNLKEFSGSNQYAFNIRFQDWQFDVTFKKEYTITVKAEAGGTAKGGGTVLDGESCTVTATPNSGYVFAGWYEGTSKVSGNTDYTFTVSSNRTFL